MLKKAGIVVATAAAGMLAVSPLAFAGDDDKGDKKIKVEKASNDASTGGEGLVNIQDNNIANCLVEVEILEKVAGLVNLGVLGAATPTIVDKQDDSCTADSSDNVKQKNEDD